MAISRKGSKSQALEWLRGQGIEHVDEGLAARLVAQFPDVSPRTLRSALLESGLTLSPLVEGVRQDNLNNLERTLVALAREYESGDRERRRQVRETVITARKHTEFAARRKPKAEELLWIRTWLQNPPLFADWLSLRKRACLNSSDTM